MWLIGYASIIEHGDKVASLAKTSRIVSSWRAYAMKLQRGDYLVLNQPNLPDSTIFTGKYVEDIRGTRDYFHRVIFLAEVTIPFNCVEHSENLNPFSHVAS